MAKCHVMNPINGMMQKIRVLLDSGANLSLFNNDVTTPSVGNPSIKLISTWKGMPTNPTSQSSKEQKKSRVQV